MMTMHDDRLALAACASLSHGSHAHLEIGCGVVASDEQRSGLVVSKQIFEEREVVLRAEVDLVAVAEERIVGVIQHV